VHVATGLTPEQIKAYRLMDNRSADETEWDVELVELEIVELNAMGVDMSTTGFTEKEVAAMFAHAGAAGGLTEPDAVPDVPETPVSVAGDLWLLGEHAVCPYCGTDNDA
jgi:hypothetical protein